MKLKDLFAFIPGVGPGLLAVVKVAERIDARGWLVSRGGKDAVPVERGACGYRAGNVWAEYVFTLDGERHTLRAERGLTVPAAAIYLNGAEFRPGRMALRKHIGSYGIRIEVAISGPGLARHRFDGTVSLEGER